MSRLNLVDVSHATLKPIKEKLGANLPPPVRVLANSPAAMSAFFALHGTLGQGQLTPRIREQIALAVGNAQGCRYCVSHHTQLGRKTGLSDEELDQARSGKAPDAKVEAALQFSRQIAARRGAVTDAELAAVRAAGWSDGDVVEILAQVVATTFGNYLNHLAQTEIDIPPVDLVPSAVIDGIHA
ncbi:carboxymuconolactone decarboxylase family protein [Corallococcus sp. 4LFB]|uniref:carboxymuconolactone decarboxylase family protein n=1 Tax=Corallococcus sp. 4LFB TaxID=3383249 RepID=UPI0039756169